MITPVQIFNLHKNIYPVFQQPKAHYFAENLQKDVFIPSFTGEAPVSDFDNELKNLNGIRCARCNQRMLSEEKYDNLLKNIAQVKTGTELEKLLTENKQYLNDSNSIILKDLKEINTKYPDADIKTVLYKIDKHAPKIYAETCRNNIELIKLVTEKLFMSEHNKQEYLKAVERLEIHKDFQPYDFNKFAQIMNETLRETDYPRKEKLYKKVMIHQGRAYNYYKNITSRHISAQSAQSGLRSLGKALFKRSVSEIRSITKYENIENPANKILICRDCDVKTQNSTRYYKYSDESEMLKNHLTQYVQDINNAINNNELHINSSYINELTKNISKTSNRKITLNGNDWSFIEYKENFTDLPFENIEGLPCPKCNAIMLTHVQRERIFKRINETSSIKELSDIIKEYDKYFPPTTKIISEKFRDNFIRDPYITDTLMKKNMTAFVRKLCHREITDFIKAASKKLSDPSYTAAEKNKLEKLAKNLNDYDKHTKMFYNSAHLKTILFNAEAQKDEDKFRLKEKGDELLAKIEILQGPVCHSTNLIGQENYSWSKVFTERIFKKSVFTKDHLIARNNGGSDELNNKIGLHRECNQLKGQKSPSSWIRKNPEIEDYMANYLRKINEYARNGKIKECDNYAKDIANKIFYLCGGSNKLKKEFSD